MKALRLVTREIVLREDEILSLRRRLKSVRGLQRRLEEQGEELTSLHERAKHLLESPRMSPSPRHRRMPPVLDLDPVLLSATVRPVRPVFEHPVLH